MLTEKKVLKKVEMLLDSDAIQVQWSLQVLRGDVVIAETYERASFLRKDKVEFLKVVADGLKYTTAMGW